MWKCECLWVVVKEWWAKWGDKQLESTNHTSIICISDQFHSGNQSLGRLTWTGRVCTQLDDFNGVIELKCVFSKKLPLVLSVCLWTGIAVEHVISITGECNWLNLKSVEKNVGVVVMLEGSSWAGDCWISLCTTRSKIEVVEELEPELLVSTEFLLSGLVVGVHQTELLNEYVW